MERGSRRGRLGSGKGGLCRAVGGVLACCAATVALSAAGSGATSPDVEVRASDGRLVLFDYRPGDPVLSPLGDSDWETVTLSGSEPGREAGTPDLPTRVVMLGVPHGADLRLSVLAAGSRDLGRHRIAPVPRWEGPEAGSPMGRPVYEEGPAYAGSAEYPAEPARILREGVFRGQRVVVVEVVPFRYRPDSGDLEFLGPMTLALEITGGRTEGTAAGPDIHEAWFRTNLLNYDSARAWRRAPTAAKGVTAPGGFEQGTRWFRLGTTTKGMYRVTGSALADAGLDLSSVDPGEVRLFWGGGRPLSEDLDPAAVASDWMEECALWVRDLGTTGVLDAEDEIIFYGLGAQGWASDFDGRNADGEWWRNAYTDTNVYWLATGGTFGGSRRDMQTKNLGWDAADPRVLTSSPQWMRDEKNRIENYEIAYEDGWMYANFDNATHEQLIPFSLEDVDTTGVSRLRVRLCGQRDSAARHEATVSLDFWPLVTVSWMSDHAADIDTVARAAEGTNYIGIKVATSDTSEVAEVALAWAEVKYWRTFHLGSQVPVRAPDSTCVVEYRADLDAPGPVYVFDVTEARSPVRIDSVFVAGSTAAFRDSARADSASRYMMVRAWNSCAFVRADDPPDLRTNRTPADILILYHPKFEDAALDLAAHHAARWAVRTVNIFDVYDEFSWGLFDPVAVRDFLSYASTNYAELGKAGPGYAILLGDASYNYRAEGSITIPNYVPSWHGRYRHGAENIYSTDDWYAYLDPHNELMDLAIGRLPVQTTEEAQAVVDKIIAYDADPEYGPWRSRVVVSADDLGKKCVFTPCEVVHTEDADGLVTGFLPPSLELRKIYLTEYPYLNCRKASAQEDFRAAMDDGALLTLFIGHGDRSKLADEELYVWRSTEPPTNAGRPTFFIAGSCEVGDFAQPTGSSLGENLLRQAESGAVAVFSSTYLAYSVFNYRLIREYFRSLFPGREIPDDVTLGGALLDAKNAIRLAGLEVGRPYHNERLELLGDPAMVLAAPRWTVSIDGADTLEFVRRGTRTLHGHVLNGGATATAFDGTAFIEVFGTADTTGHQVVNHLGQPLNNCGTDHVSYTLAGPPLYRGSAEVEGGQFVADLIVPWDAAEGHLARVQVYASGEGEDAVGAADSIVVGGMAPTTDTDGPSFLITRDGEPVGEGARIDPEGALRLCFDDPSGINIQGASDTSAVLLVVDASAFVDLTPECEYESGSATRACSDWAYDLETGSHTIELRATDNVGNRSTRSWTVEVSPEGQLRLTGVYPYPNPFQEGTYFLYELSRDAEVTVRIFTVAGHPVRTISAGFQGRGPQHVYWDGRDEELDRTASGAYLFRVEAKADGSTASALGKAVRLR